MVGTIEDLFHEDHGFGANDIVMLSDHPPDRHMQVTLPCPPKSTSFSQIDSVQG